MSEEKYEQSGNLNSAGLDPALYGNKESPIRVIFCYNVDTKQDYEKNNYRLQKNRGVSTGLN